MTAAQWTLLTLLIVSIFLNYIDRGTLSVAAPVIEKDFLLSPASLGSLFSAFFWTYALLQLFGVAGWAADRFPVGIVLAVGAAVWSASTVMAGLANGFMALFIARLLLGAGESLAYPCYSRILASDFAAHHRGMANALLDAGSKLGPALGTYIGAMMLASFGWRAFFIALGVVSLLWLVPWLIYMPRSYATATIHQDAGPRTADILCSRSAWGTFAGHFCGNYYWFFLLTWLPTYLVRERGFSLEAMGQVGGIAYLVIASATVCAGWASDRWIARGGTPTRVRKSIVVGGLTGSTIILPVAVVEDTNTAIALLLLACASFGIYTSNHWAITQTLAGPRAAGRWTSLQNGLGNLSGIAAAWITGEVVERTGAFPPAFFVSAGLALLGALLWGFVVGPVRQVEWKP
ncbi:MAG: MFS transporter [Bryobacterales bacterium]|nr:MFS transporter [Bryobacterales bacterium]